MYKKVSIFFLLILTISFVFAGWHQASQVLPGTFPEGNFVFNGSIKIGVDTGLCTSAKEGSTRYDSTSNVLQLCDGNNWVDVGTGAGGGTGEVLPVGTIIPFSDSTTPTGYLECNGSAVSRTTYADLFAVIGTTYGVGDGSTTFNLPDLRGEFLRGWDNGRGADPNAAVRTGGDTIGSWQNDAFENHRHTVRQIASMDVNGGSMNIYGPAGSFVDYTGYDSGLGSETRPRNIAVMFIIKATSGIASDSIWSANGNDIYYNTGAVGIGTSVLDSTSVLTMVGDGIDKDVHLYAYSSDSARAKGDYEMFRARGTVASPSIILDEDSLGSIRWRAYDGAGFHSVAQIEAIIDGTPGNNDLPTRLQFEVTKDGASSNTAVMYIFSSGHVGIGTTNTDPGRDLYVRDATSSSWVGIEGATGNDAGIAFYEGSTYRTSMFYDASDDKFRIANRAAEPIEFSVNRDGTEVVAMTINSTGSVGIGTGSPTEQLDVNGNVLFGDSLDITPSGLGVGHIRVNGNGYKGFIALDASAMYVGHNSASRRLDFMTDETTRLSISAGGAVGVGSVPVSSTHRLLIAGPGAGTSTTTFGLVVRESSAVTNNLWIRDDGAGYLRAAAWSYGSDRRMKENIEYFDGGLDTVLSLKPAKFDYINGSQDSIGFIAQDVQEVIPEAVEITDNETGMLGLKSNFIVPYLVNSIKELKSQNDELKSFICSEHPDAEICN